MKKILYIGNNLDINRYTTSIAILSSNLRKINYKVNVYSNRKNKFFRLFDMITALIVNSKKVDYILIDTFSTQNFYYAFILSQLARLYNTKYITILRGGNLPFRLQKSKILSKLIFKNAYKIIAPSYYLIEAFEKANFHVDYIPNTIDLSLYDFKKREILQPKLLWVRAFKSLYNPEMAVRVLAILKKKYPNATLCMIGPIKDDSFNRSKQLAKELNVIDAIEFTGALPKTEWIKKAENFDVFINTTTIDNTPVSVIEAMALGLAIVSTNVGGVPYLITDNKEGLLVSSGDAKCMVKSIEYLLQNPNKVKKLTDAAREKVEQFDWEVVKHQWEEILS